jgi:hypothetical protein
MNEDEIDPSGAIDSQDGLETTPTTNTPEPEPRTYRDGAAIEYATDGSELPDHPDEWYDDYDTFMESNPTYGMTPAQIAAYESQIAPDPAEVTPAAPAKPAASAPVAPVAEPAVAPVVAKPAYVPPPMPTLLPAITPEEKQELNDLALVDPFAAMQKMAERNNRETNAVNAVKNWQRNGLRKQYPKFADENGIVIDQILDELPSNQLSDPRVPAYIISEVQKRTAYQIPQTREDILAHMKKQIALLEGDEVPAVAVAPTVALKSAAAAPRTPALAPSQRATTPTVASGGGRPAASATTRKNIPTKVRSIMDFHGVTQSEAERFLEHAR